LVNCYTKIHSFTQSFLGVTKKEGRQVRTPSNTIQTWYRLKVSPEQARLMSRTWQSSAPRSCIATSVRICYSYTVHNCPHLKLTINNTTTQSLRHLPYQTKRLTIRMHVRNLSLPALRMFQWNLSSSSLITNRSPTCLGSALLNSAGALPQRDSFRSLSASFALAVVENFVKVSTLSSLACASCPNAP
jgi:hypothetical protein